MTVGRDARGMTTLTALKLELQDLAERTGRIPTAGEVQALLRRHGLGSAVLSDLLGASGMGTGQRCRERTDRVRSAMGPSPSQPEDSQASPSTHGRPMRCPETPTRDRRGTARTTQWSRR